MAVKAVNDTVGPHGLCPSLLVFGTFPKLPDISPRDFSTQRERKRAMVSARKEYEKIVGKRIIARGIRAIPLLPPVTSFYPVTLHMCIVKVLNITPASPHCLRPWQEVRVHTGESSGPDL